MRRRSEIISMGLSIAIAAVLLIQLLPLQSPPIRNLPKASKPVPMVPPKSVALAAVPLPGPPSAPVLVATATTPAAAPELVTPMKPTSRETLMPVKTVEPLEPHVEKANPVKVEPIKPVTTAATALEKPIIPLKKLGVASPSPQPTPTKPAQTPTPQTVGTTDTTPLMASGRSLLRLLEHGDGPSIDIAWPRNARGREALFQSFAECYGMMVVLMASNGDLYSDRNTSGPWGINRDRYSGFVRQSGAPGTTGERAWSRRILHRHPRASDSTTIRVFPRAMDALLIGGLSRLLGEDYRFAKSIGARYVQTGNQILIDDIVADGLPVAGRIDLTAAGSRRCRASAKPKGI